MKKRRRPVPPGLSAETSFRIDREGSFWADGDKVTHPGLRRVLPSWLGYDHDAERYFLHNQVNWGFVQVDDAPFAVRGTKWGPVVRVALSDESVEALALATLRIDADDVLYCDVKGGQFPARFCRQAAHDLLVHARLDNDNVWLDVEGESVAIRRVPRGQGAARS